MIYEYKKYSLRVNNGLIFSRILLKINLIIYDKALAFLSLYKENDVVKIITDICLKEITSLENSESDKTREEIIKLYAENTAYFEKKYSIKESDYNKIETEDKKADYLLSSIIKTIYGREILKSESQSDEPFNVTTIASLASPALSLLQKTAIDKFIQSNTYDCPILVQKSNTSVNKYALNSQGEIPYYFITNSDCFVGDPSNKKLFYYDSSNSPFTSSGFHFEKYVIFDFDKKGFPQSQLATYIYNNLNLSFFLDGKDASLSKNIIVNPEIFKKIFPISLKINAESNKEIVDSLPNFIKNIRVGLRLVYRETKKINAVEVPKIFLSGKFASSNSKSIKYLQSKDKFPILNNNFLLTLKVQNSTEIEKSVNNVNLDVLRNKSLFILSEIEGITYTNKLVPIVSVESSQFNIKDYNIKKLHDFINYGDMDLLQKLIQEQQKFIDLFGKIIPLKIIDGMARAFVSSNNQKIIDSYMSGKVSPPKQLSGNIQVAKIIKENAKSSLNDIVIKKEQ